MWQVSIPIAVTLSGGLLAFAIKEPRIYLKLAGLLQAILIGISALGMAFYSGIQYSLRLVHQVRMDLYPESEVLAKGADKAYDALSQGSDWGWYALLIYFFTASIVSVAAYLARQVLADREEVAKTQRAATNPDE